MGLRERVARAPVRPGRRGRRLHPRCHFRCPDQAHRELRDRGPAARLVAGWPPHRVRPADGRAGTTRPLRDDGERYGSHPPDQNARRGARSLVVTRRDADRLRGADESERSFPHLHRQRGRLPSRPAHDAARRLGRPVAGLVPGRDADRVHVRSRRRVPRDLRDGPGRFPRRPAHLERVDRRQPLLVP